MTLEQFQELAPKTVNDLTIQIPFEEEQHLSLTTLSNITEMGRRANLGHMVQGMAIELLSEFTIAGLTVDLDNVLEEATDAKWFIVVAAWMKDIQLSNERLENHIISSPDVERLNLLAGDDGYVSVMNICVGTLGDVLKRESCYGKPKYQGQLISDEDYITLFYDAIRSIDLVLMEEGIDPEVGYDRVIEKLHGVRYKNEDGSVSFSEDKALNRDLGAERKAIDN